MLSKGLERFVLTEYWLRTETRIHGEYRGYWFNIAEEDRLTSFETVYPFTSDQLRALTVRLELIKLPKRKTEIVGNERAIALYIKGKQPLSYEEVIDILKYFAAELTAIGIEPQLCCGSCGKPGNFPLSELGLEKTFPMCEPCFAQGQVDLLQADAHLAKADFHYIRGTVGGLLGALLATIPWILLEQMGFIGALLAYFIGKGAFRGYVLTGAQIGPRTPRIIVAITGVPVLMAHLMALGFVIQPGYSWFSLRFLRYLVTTPELSRSVWGGLAMGIFTAGLGIQQIILDIHEATTVPTLKRL